MDLNSHGIIIEKTGFGKSNYLLHILKHVDQEYCNIVLIDPHGLTADSFISLTEKETICSVAMTTSVRKGNTPESMFSALPEGKKMPIAPVTG